MKIEDIIAKDECPLCKGTGLLAVNAAVARLRNLPRCGRCKGKGHIADETETDHEKESRS